MQTTDFPAKQKLSNLSQEQNGGLQFSDVLGPNLEYYQARDVE